MRLWCLLAASAALAVAVEGAKAKEEAKEFASSLAKEAVSSMAKEAVSSLTKEAFSHLAKEAVSPEREKEAEMAEELGVADAKEMEGPIPNSVKLPPADTKPKTMRRKKKPKKKRLGAKKALKLAKSSSSSSTQEVAPLKIKPQPSPSLAAEEASDKNTTADSVSDKSTADAEADSASDKNTADPEADSAIAEVEDASSQGNSTEASDEAPGTIANDELDKEQKKEVKALAEEVVEKKLNKQQSRSWKSDPFLLIVIIVLSVVGVAISLLAFAIVIKNLRS